MASINSRLEKIEGQINVSAPVKETAENRWAFDLARKKFETPYDETARKVEEFFKTVRTDPSPEEAEKEPEDVPNPDYIVDPEQRAVKIQEYVSELITRYGDHEGYKAAQQQPDFVDKFFKQLIEKTGSTAK